LKSPTKPAPPPGAAVEAGAALAGAAFDGAAAYYDTWPDIAAPAPGCALSALWTKVSNLPIICSYV